MKTRSFVFILLGGIAFWAPVSSIEFVTRHELNLVLGSLLPPATLLACYGLIGLKQKLLSRATSLWMLLGVYMLGPLFMMISATPVQGGFSQFHGWSAIAYLLFCTVVPVMTLMLSGYDKTILGVIVATVLMLLIHFVIERRRGVHSSHMAET
jgi:hypothetical protein